MITPSTCPNYEKRHCADPLKKLHNCPDSTNIFKLSKLNYTYSLQCNLCGRKLKTPTNLSFHRQRHRHTSDAQSNLIKKNKKIKTSNDLSFHGQKHSSTINVWCNQCGNKFKTSDNLMLLHEKKHKKKFHLDSLELSHK